MAEYNYGDIIEYIDGTIDENFENARRWAFEHGTTFDELLDRRNLPKRYFQIGQEPVIPKPTEDDKKDYVRGIRNEFLVGTDFTQLNDAPFDDTKKGYYREYRQYLRDYTAQESWWEQIPMTYEEWSVGHHPVEEE